MLQRKNVHKSQSLSLCALKCENAMVHDFRQRDKIEGDRENHAGAFFPYHFALLHISFSGPRNILIKNS